MANSILLSDLAERLGARLDGPGDVAVDGIAPIEEAVAGQVTFLANPKYAEAARRTKATAVLAKERVPGSGAAYLLTDNPYHAYACVVEILHPPQRPAPGVSPMASVHPGARLGKDVTVEPFVTVGEGSTIGDGTVLSPGVRVGRDVTVGAGCFLYPNVVLYDGVRLGDRVVLHAGCVIGSDGFGFAPSPKGFKKILQVGTVEIGDDVEIGANTAIDRAALGVTRIGRGSKLDNLIQVGHNVEIGSDTVIAAQAGIAGSCRIGSQVMIGGQAGLGGHIEIGDGVRLAARSGVAQSISASTSKAWSGTPAVPHTTWLRYVTALPRLPEALRRLAALEREENSQRGDE